MPNEISVSMDDQIARARYEYLSDLTLSLTDVLHRYQLPMEVIRQAEEEEWSLQKKRYFDEQYSARNAIYREEASKRRLPIVNTQLQIVEKLQGLILTYMAEAEDSGNPVASSELRRLSETLASVTGSINALLGIKEALNEGQKTSIHGGGGDQYFFFPGAEPLNASSRTLNASIRP